MSLPGKQILDKFQVYLSESYAQYCELHDQPPSIEGFITYIIDQDLVSHSGIRRYTILKEYLHLSKSKDAHGQKTKLVALLASRFNISERSIWSLLRNTKQINVKD
ncbi:MAG: hypothetical protein AAFP19_25705 [Bacteroidota bacterium]